MFSLVRETSFWIKWNQAVISGVIFSPLLTETLNRLPPPVNWWLASVRVPWPMCSEHNSLCSLQKACRLLQSLSWRIDFKCTQKPTALLSSRELTGQEMIAPARRECLGSCCGGFSGDCRTGLQHIAHRIQPEASRGEKKPHGLLPNLVLLMTQNSN